MSPTEEANLEAARRYLDALSRGAMAEALEMYTEDVVQEEFPNRLMPTGARRGIAELREGARRGAQVMAAQRWEVRNAVASGDTVALEVLWTGTLAIPLGTLAAGDEMRAHFAVFLQFRDGLIAAQRNYDCFDPW
jgi:ketosteroid isomerase-like protein